MIASFSLQLLPYPLLMSVFYFFQFFIISHIKMTYSTFTLPLLNSLILLLAFIPEVRYRFVLRRRLTLRLTDMRSIPVLNIDSWFSSVKLENSRVKHKQSALLLGAGVLTFISGFSIRKSSMTQSFGISAIQFLFGVLFSSSLCYVIFKRRLYRHHYLAVAIIVFSSVVYYWGHYQAWLYYINLIFKGSFGWYVYNQFFVGLLWSFQEVIEFYLMMNDFISPYWILTVEGLVSFVLNAVYCGIAQLLPTIEDGSVFAFINSAKWKNLSDDFSYLYEVYSYSLLIIVGYIVLGLLMHIFRIQTNKKLSPINRHFSENIYVLLFFIHDLFEFELRLSTLYRFLHTFALIIAFCIFNEHIIIHKFRLETNTVTEIEKRSNEDYVNIKEIEPLVQVELLN